MYRFIDLNHIAILSRIDHLNRDLPDLHLASKPGKEDIRTAREIPENMLLRQPIICSPLRLLHGNEV